MAYIDSNIENSSAAELHDPQEKEKKKSLLEVTRSIEFYILKQRAANPDKLPIPLSHKLIYAALVGTDKKNRWSTVKSNGERFHCWPEKNAKYSCPITIGITRRKARNGVVSEDFDLEGYELAENADAVEYSHLLILANNVVCFECNPHGPTINQFADYLAEKHTSLGKPVFEPLFHRNSLERLEKREHFKRLSFRVTKDNFPLFAEATDNSHQILDGRALDNVIFKYIDVSFTPSKEHDFEFQELARRIGRFFLSQPDPQAALKKSGAKFYGKNTAALTRSYINLVADKIVDRRIFDLVSLRDKRVKSESAFTILKKVYHDNEEELLKAIAISVPEDDE